MEKRVLLAISLSFVVLFAYQMLAPKPPLKTPPRPPITAGKVVGQSTTPSGAAPAAPAGAALYHDVKTPETTSTARVGDTAEHEVTVDTNYVHAIFSNRGALLKSWTLKKYLD